MLLHNVYEFVHMYICHVHMFMCGCTSVCTSELCACVFKCMCVYCVFMGEFMHTCACVFVCVCAYAFMCVLNNVFEYVHMCAHVCVWLRAHVSMSMCVHVCVCVCVSMSIYVCTYVQRMVLRQGGDKSEPQKVRVVSFPIFQK